MRTENAIRNSMSAIVSQAAAVAAKALTQVVFVRTLNAEYLGINGLFGNILTMLSLAELGAGSAILYNLYEPVAKGDEKRIKELMNFYRSAYIKIGFFVFIAGMALMPWLGVLMKEQPDIEGLQLIYALYVINNAVSYFFVYKQAVLIASQQNYIIMRTGIVKNVVTNAVQIMILLLTHEFLAYLSVSILAAIIGNVVNSYIADSQFPYLKGNKEYLDKSKRRAVYRDMYAMMAHKLGGVIVTGTDNLLLSAFIGVEAVGLYSNYVIILTSVKGFLNQVYESLLSSIGNLVHTESGEAVYLVYKKLYLMGFWITSLIAIGFACLANPVIRLAFGEGYVLDRKVVFLMALNFYVTDLSGMRAVPNKFKNAYGLFWQDRYKPYFESVLNLAASVFLLKTCGFAGVLLGTLFSTLCTCFWIEPYVLFRYGFQKSIREYFKSYAGYLFLFTAAWLAAERLTWWVASGISILGGILVCLAVPSILFWIFLRKSREYCEMRTLAGKVLERFFHRRAA